jgi:glycosyltransferase involved in cell wall biosynthesis
LKILIGVHQFFPVFYTGTERYVLNLAKQFQRMGHYVKVLTYAFNDQTGFIQAGSARMLRKEYSFEGVPIIAIKHNDQPDHQTFLFDLTNKDIYHEVKEIFKKDDFDIYHCAHPFRIASSVKAARDADIKTVLILTDYWLMCPLGIMMRPDSNLCDGPDHGQNCLRYCFTNISRDRILKRIADVHALLKCCDYALAPSQFLINLFNSSGVVSADRFILSRHGFDYGKKKNLFLRQFKETITFGYIGTILYHKGVHVMVEGFKKNRHKNIRLQVWGGCFHEVDYQERLLKIVDGDSRIEFKGYYDFNDVENILENIDVVIVPSIWYENAPLTILTSLAYGIPVITSNIGGMSEMIRDGHNGLTFKAGDPADLSAKIGLIADNPELIMKFKKNIQYPIRVEEEAFNTELVYKQLLS